MKANGKIGLFKSATNEGEFDSALLPLTGN